MIRWLPPELDLLHRPLAAPSPWPRRFRGAAAALLIPNLLTWPLLPFRPFVDDTLALMLQLLGVAVVALGWGLPTAGATALLGMVCFDLAFFEDPGPGGTFHIHVHLLVLFAGMMALAHLVATLVTHLRREAAAARDREAEAHRLLQANLDLQAEHRAQVARAEAEATRSALLSAVSHDLRTPLASLQGAASLLASEAQDPEEVRELATVMVKESRRLSHLVDNLLDITRLERENLELNRAWHSLQSLAGDVLQRLEEHHGPLPLALDLPPDLPPLFLDGVLIDQLLSNLVENALLHAPDSALRLSARLETGSLDLRLVDHGPGIPEALAERIFEKFVQARPTDGGCGLGLAICRAIAHAHGGTIRVEPTPGGGATFVVWLPVQEGLP